MKPIVSGSPHTTASGAPATVELAASGLVLAGEPLAASYHRFLDAVTRPFQEHFGFDAYAAPAPPGFGDHVTYCGT